MEGSGRILSNQPYSMFRWNQPNQSVLTMSQKRDSSFTAKLRLGLLNRVSCFFLFSLNYHLLKQSFSDCTAAHATNNRLTVQKKDYKLLVHTRISIPLERYVDW